MEINESENASEYSLSTLCFQITTNMTTTVEEVIYPESWCLGASAFAVFFCVFGFCGNFLTIAALLRCERLRKHATTGEF